MKILALTLKVVVVWRTEMHDGCEALALQDNVEASSDFPLAQLEAVEPAVLNATSSYTILSVCVPLGPPCACMCM